MPSARCQYAPSGPARTNSKSRNPYGLAKFSFARLISFASRLLSCVFRAGKRKTRRRLVSATGFFAWERTIRLRMLSFRKYPAVDPVACQGRRNAHRLRGDAAFLRAPARRERPFRFGRVRHAVAPPFFMPSRVRNAHDKGQSPRRRGRKQSEGEKSETNLPTVPPAHLGGNVFRSGEATSSRPRRLAPTPVMRTS